MSIEKRYFTSDFRVLSKEGERRHAEWLLRRTHAGHVAIALDLVQERRDFNKCLDRNIPVEAYYAS